MTNVLLGVGIGIVLLFSIWAIIANNFKVYMGSGCDCEDDESVNQYKQNGFKAGVDYSMVLIRELFKKENLMVTNWDTFYKDLINKDGEMVKAPDVYVKLLNEYKEYVTNLGKDK